MFLGFGKEFGVDHRDSQLVRKPPAMCQGPVVNAVSLPASLRAAVDGGVCCLTNSLSRGDTDKEVGGRPTQGAVAERVGPSGSNSANCLILYPLILSFSRREKERIMNAASVSRIDFPEAGHWAMKA